ncbi:MAG: cytochrome c peroxidase [Flavobacterium sp.]
MFNTKFLFFPSILFVFGVYGFNFFTADSDEDYTNIQDYKEIIDPNIDALKNEIEVLQHAAQDFQKNSQSLPKLKRQLLETRKAYKKVEFILVYFYPEHIEEYINGIPFDHVNPNPTDEKYNTNNYYHTTPQEYAENIPLDNRDTDRFRGKTDVVHPNGLQVLDALIFSDNPETEKEEIVALTQKLEVNFGTIERTFKQRKYIADFEIIEASRLELIRIFSLGITGYDTPGSLNVIDEADSSLKALKEIVGPLLLQSNSTGTLIAKLFDDGSTYLKKNHDFNKFDRLTFLTAYINPLYKNLLNVQKKLGIPSSSEKYGNLASWNAHSDNIFAGNFLNPYYYSLLKAENDSPLLNQLGKEIFSDASLSKSGKISCVSCHKPDLAFTDGLPKSLSNIEGIRVARNSPSLLNAVYSDRFFYDLRAYDLEDQAEHVIENHLEFDTNYPEMINKINTNPKYIRLFKAAFNKDDTTITRSQFAAALSSYIISLQSFNSKFDQYVLGKTDAISEDAKRGFNLFMGKANCATCHFAPTFSGLVPPLYRDNDSEVLGVLKSPKSHEIDSDLGRIQNSIELDHFSIYNNSFKTTTVRNAELTAPYFHNGAYKTLDEVIDFYNQGGASGIGLSYEVPNQTLPSGKLKLSSKEIKELKAFIKSLTDNPFSNKKI